MFDESQHAWPWSKMDDAEIVPPGEALGPWNISIRLPGDVRMNNIRIFFALPRTHNSCQYLPIMRERKSPTHLASVEIGNRTTLIMVTVCTQDRKRILACKEAHDLLRSSWLASDAWRVGRYMILPDHIHLFCSPNGMDATSLHSWVRFWKTSVTRQWSMPNERRIWQKDFWDRQMRRGESYSAKWEYVLNNPVRHGLVKDATAWPWQGELYPLEWHDI